MKLLTFAVAACALAVVQAKQEILADLPTLPTLPGVKAKVDKQIVGGSPAALKQFPWQVAIVADNAIFCGGSWISYNWVLTAGHCVYNRTNFTINFGIVKLNTFTVGRVQIQSSVVVRHPDYNPNTLNNDVALIYLLNVLGASDTMSQIRLPRMSDSSKTFNGTVATASGWGATANGGAVSPVLNSVDRTVITNAVCAKTFGNITVVNSTLCVDASSSKAICQGDSGGPLVYKEADGAWTLIGVTSFTASKCTGNPQGFARVTSFLPWIKSVSTQISIRT